MMVRPLPPVLVVDLFPLERARLIEFCTPLSPQEWARDTVCPGWSVKDIAGHLLGDDIGKLSHQRDGHANPLAAGLDLDDWTILVEFINRQNGLWVDAMRRVSPRLLLELLRITGQEIHQLFQSLDLFALGGAVNWAGPQPAPVWLDVAREYTERWLHQQQIRDALGDPGLKEPSLFAPVLAAFVRALPRTFRDSPAPSGTIVRLVIEGPSGGSWDLAREEQHWALGQAGEDRPQALTRLDEDTAWRVFTKGLTPEQARRKAVLEGDPILAAKVLETVSILA